jgi:hypothetical protein
MIFARWRKRNFSDAEVPGFQPGGWQPAIHPRQLRHVPFRINPTNYKEPFYEKHKEQITGGGAGDVTDADGRVCRGAGSPAPAPAAANQ